MDKSQLKKYNFPLEDIPRYRHDDPRGDECIALGKPVILEDSDLTRSALHWDLEYLGKNMPKTDCPVLLSPSTEFKYFRDKQDDVNVDAPDTTNKYLENFVPPTKTVNMKVTEFHQRLKAWKEGDDRMYLQLPLNNSVGRAIAEDFVNFRWQWVHSKQKIGSWGSLTSNLLFIGMEGNVSPCHYDEQENLFSQTKGYKQCILFPPEQFECLYPYPVFHPHDRQSQVDFDNPDFKRFPKFKDVKGVQGVVGPGDVLYIPTYWWHHIVSVGNDPYTVSINFWLRSNPKSPIKYPLNGSQKMAIMRNTEKMLKDVLKDPDEVGPLLRALVLGRYTE